MSDDRSGRAGTRERRESSDGVPRRSRGGCEPSIDATFDVLSDRQRRIVLSHLSRTGGAAGIAELVERVVAWERELGGGPPSEREAVRIALEHVHLPKLSAAGLVEVDAADARVEYRPSERVERFLRVLAREGPLP
jgi:DNA-binding transcriptional ArsR family regulator